ncbi:GNAT family N-acetyltransferase [Corticicoccus populi]|uniref:GNAT family N-acetyltransferase n=1 Tax=Corticicoccus populi TaxID=1812821 RepID=A0ABW5WYA9_9STAP
MIQFEEITENNFWQVTGLNVNEEQKKFVAPNMQSLAECYLYREAMDVFPYAVVYEGKVIGFILIDIEEEKREYMIWRMMIDKNYQRRGFGKQVVERVIQSAKDSGEYDVLIADYVKGNDGMGVLLRSLGFKDHSFDEENNEYVLHYHLT